MPGKRRKLSKISIIISLLIIFFIVDGEERQMLSASSADVVFLLFTINKLLKKINLEERNMIEEILYDPYFLIFFYLFLQ